VDEAELDIVRRAMQGNQLALSQLFHRYSRPVLSFLYGMVGLKDLAEDLMQETISRAFLLLGNLRDETKFSTWLFGIARNVARENIRRRIRDLKHMKSDNPNVGKLLGSKASPETDVMKQQLFQAIAHGLNALDEEPRMVLTLRVFAEKKYQEIAEITGWSLAKVKTEIHRARAEMRKRMAPYL
jgi:RNA polymerase sigma-70 factor (ECF subfamily)